MLGERKDVKEVQLLKSQLKQYGSFGDMAGNSPQMLEVYRLIEMVAPSTASVLITGESGTGKELVARNIHLRSKRSEGPFIAINCSAIPETLMESEIFGHEKGAFTGALERRLGCFELANGGTIFLDEIAEMPVGTQSKLLRVIEERTVSASWEQDRNRRGCAHRGCDEQAAAKSRRVRGTPQ